MGLVLDEDQLHLREQARKLLKSKAPISSLRALRDGKDMTGFSPSLWQEMSSLGWAGILVPEQSGGTGLGYQELGILLEEQGRQLTASPLWSTALAGTTALLASNNGTIRNAFLPEVAAGKAVLALAVDETAHHNPASVTSIAEPAGAGYRITGRKRWVSDGHVADLLIVLAAEQGRPGLFCVPADSPGVTRHRRWTVDSRGWADIELDGVNIPVENRLGGPDLVEQVLDAARIGVCAEMLGGISEAFERTLDYLKIRTQFGVPIGSFQALQHRAAQMFCEMELTRSVVMEALTALDEKRPDVPLLASAAKVQAGETSRLVSNEAVQMHGGIGVTDEHEIGFFLKRARVLEQLLGAAHFHRDRYAALSGY